MLRAHTTDAQRTRRIYVSHFSLQIKNPFD